MEKKDASFYKNKIITIPNILSLFRLFLIPVIIFCYFISQTNGHWYALIVFGVSALTDILDGIIARKYNMISDVGKILDPMADKLTQLALALCLAIEYYVIIPLLILLVIKDFIIGLTGLIATKKSNIVNGADWHGKLNTVLLFIVMAIHLVWLDLPFWLSLTSVCISMAMMVVTLTLYTIRNVKQYKDAKKAELEQTNIPNLAEQDKKIVNE